jgi:PilZ domain-containing protein
VYFLTESENEERRKSPRFAWAAKVVFTALPTIELEGQSVRQLLGMTENIGRGGIAIISSQPLSSAPLVRCEIPVPGIPTPIPTLLRMRWSQKTQLGGAYRLGFQFVL